MVLRVGRNHEEDPIYGRANGQDPAGGGPVAGGRGGQEARDQRRHDLRLAEAIWATGGGGRKAAAAAGAGKQPAKEAGGRTGSGYRDPEGSRGKKMVSARVRRQQIAFVCQRGRSVRRACALLSVARSTLQYEPRLPQRDAPVVAAMHELAAQYPRYGYRRIH